MADAAVGPFSRPSIFSLRLALLARGSAKGSATGFLWLPEGSTSPFLVTNYHVATATDPRRPGELLKGWDRPPDEIRYQLLTRDLSCESASIDLTSATHVEHPRRAEGVDLIAIAVDPPPEGLFLTQNRLDSVEDISLTVGSDLFIVGYPFGFAAGNVLPIWKRGTIASEPTFRPDGLDMFYIDSTTKSGMSGSPVFAAEARDLVDVGREGAQALEAFERGEKSALDALNVIGEPGPSERRQVLQLVGVYSGRITVPSGEDSQIRIVWKRSLLEELFGQRGA